MIDTQDFLTIKYEYDSIHKLNVEMAIKEENQRYERLRELNQKKSQSFEDVKNRYMESKNSDNAKNNIEFLQKRIVEKSKDLDKNNKILKEINTKKEGLIKELDKSNKKLELIYKKIEDLAQEKKLRKENIESSENIETFVLNKKFKELSEGKIKIKEELNKEEKKETSFEVEEVKSQDYSNQQNQITSVENDTLQNQISSFDTNTSFDTNHNQNAPKDHYFSFEEFEKRITNLNEAKNANGANQLSLQYNSETGAIYNIDLTENFKRVDISIVVNSYKDYLGIKNEKAKILQVLKNKGIDVKSINLRQIKKEVA